MSDAKRVSKWHVADQHQHQGLQFDGQNRINLHDVIDCFKEPISEEHAWAVIYQTVKTLSLLLQDQNYQLNNHGHGSTGRDMLVLVSQVRHILIHQDGVVADQTFLVPKSKGKQAFHVQN